MTKTTLSLPAADEGDDERVKSGGVDTVRGTRGLNDEDTSERGNPLDADGDFERLLENEFNGNALPNAPPMPGWHLCWLTTNSSYDSAAKRQRLGYMPVRKAEMPGFDASNGQNLVGYDDFVNCNELVLFKIEESRYQKMMAHYHHKQPMQEEEGIVGRFNEQGERLGGEDDGVATMEREIAQKRNRVPHFA